MVTFEFEHFYPEFEAQKFWDFLVDHEWYTQSELMPGEMKLLEAGEGAPQGLGAVRQITISEHNIELVEDVVGCEEPGYFSYAVRDGGKGMPVKGYRGEFFMEPAEGGMQFRYKGNFEPKMFGINWLFKYLFRWRMRTMVPVWAEGYELYHSDK